MNIWICNVPCMITMWHHNRWLAQCFRRLLAVFLLDVWPLNFTIEFYGKKTTTLDKKKNHHRDSRREERSSTCDIMLDHARSAQGKSDPRLSATFALRWSRLIEHDITRGTAFFSPRISRMVLFFVQGSRISECTCTVFGGHYFPLSWIWPLPEVLTWHGAVHTWIGNSKKIVLHKVSPFRSDCLSVRLK